MPLYRIKGSAAGGIRTSSTIAASEGGSVIARISGP